MRNTRNHCNANLTVANVERSWQKSGQLVLVTLVVQRQIEILLIQFNIICQCHPGFRDGDWPGLAWLIRAQPWVEVATLATSPPFVGLPSPDRLFHSDEKYCSPIGMACQRWLSRSDWISPLLFQPLHSVPSSLQAPTGVEQVSSHVGHTWSLPALICLREP